MFAILVGDFDFDGLIREHYYAGPIFIMTYLLSVMFIVLSMFLAVINDTYAEVRVELAEAKDNFGIGDFLKKVILLCC